MSEPKEVLLVATRGNEAEPVLMEQSGPDLILTLDDGERLTFDAAEFRSSLREAA